MPDPLATKRGRLLTFFLLYITEGIPLGFTATALVPQMRRHGVSPAQTGLFVASLYLPWAWKWAAGPVVDLVYSDRLGRRRAWIVACQLGMMLTLLAAMTVDFSARLTLFTAIILVHNAFGAVQDVAIDALAVSTLREDERGVANGLMFAGANVGQAIGGAGVLFLTKYVRSFNVTFVLVVAAIATITVGVALRLRERPVPLAARADDGAGAGAARAGENAGGNAGRVWAELRAYVSTVPRAMLGSVGAAAALALALLPMGAYALGLALQSNLAVELGMNDNGIATLSLFSTLLGAAGCVVGGHLSDRFGRRRMLALYVVGMVVPNLFLAAAMHRHGWVMPVDPQATSKPHAPGALMAAFWGATLAYSAFQGLMYGTRTALFMDVVHPGVAATQFTAYMAMLNLVISYSAAWQGHATVRFGYPVTLTADAAAGLVCLALLPLVRPKAKARTGTDEARPAASAQHG
jgi:PAT family beta-lactamase induction signal transducer AmpG